MRYAHVVNGFVQRFYATLPRAITLANGLKVSNPHGSRAELMSKYGIYEVRDEELEMFQRHGEAYIDGIYVVRPAVDLPIEEIKVKLWEDARREMRRALDQGVVVDDIRLATDDESLSRLTGASIAAKPDKIYLLRSRDNRNYHVSGTKVEEYHLAVYEYWYGVMENYWNFTALLEEMQTVDELRSHALYLKEGF
jgi:hypothetical protein